MIEASGFLLGVAIFFIVVGVAHMFYVCSSPRRYDDYMMGRSLIHRWLHKLY